MKTPTKIRSSRRAHRHLGDNRRSNWTKPFFCPPPIDTRYGVIKTVEDKNDSHRLFPINRRVRRCPRRGQQTAKFDRQSPGRGLGAVTEHKAPQYIDRRCDRKKCSLVEFFHETRQKNPVYDKLRGFGYIGKKRKKGKKQRKYAYKNYVLLSSMAFTGKGEIRCILVLDAQRRWRGEVPQKLKTQRGLGA